MTETAKTPRANFKSLDPDLDAIRAILTEADPLAQKGSRLRSHMTRTQDTATDQPKPRQARKADHLPELEHDAPASDHSAAPPQKRKFSMRRPAPDKHLRREQQAGGLSSGSVVGRIRRFRPKPAHIFLALAVLLIVLRPWLVLGLLLISCLVLFGVILIVGYDGFWKSIINGARWYARRRPSRAKGLQARLDRIAVRWDTVLDRFPEGSVDGLYLPDFGTIDAQGSFEAGRETRDRDEARHLRG